MNYYEYCMSAELAREITARAQRRSAEIAEILREIHGQILNAAQDGENHIVYALQNPAMYIDNICGALRGLQYEVLTELDLEADCRKLSITW